MTKWSELERNQKYAITILVVIVLVVIILALYGYLTGAWEKPQDGASHGYQDTLFSYKQAGWSPG
ncbi:MAG TPA: hypothetical protein VH593_23245 [Ktedonobacteraceae bacterium]